MLMVQLMFSSRQEKTKSLSLSKAYLRFRAEFLLWGTQIDIDNELKPLSHMHPNAAKT